VRVDGEALWTGGVSDNWATTTNGEPSRREGGKSGNIPQKELGVGGIKDDKETERVAVESSWESS
jgi:hypothetical protein